MLGMLISFGFIVLIINILSNISNKLNNESNMQKFGSLYSDTDFVKYESRKKIAHFYIIVFLLRRLFYSWIIIFLYEWPLMQQILNISVHSILLLYDLFMQPYSFKKIIGIMIYSFDFIAVVIFATLPVYLSPNSHAEDIGRFHIYLIVATFVISWITIVAINIINIYQKYTTPPESIPDIKNNENNEPRAFVMNEEV